MKATSKVTMKPILFNTSTIQAILDGRKTQTRRPVEPQPRYELRPHNGGWSEYSEVPLADEASRSPWGYDRKSSFQPGDILWVREPWRVGAWDDDQGSICVDYKADGYARKEWIPIENSERFNRYWIESTDDAQRAGLICDDYGRYHWEPGQGPTRWRPSIHMPKEAARLFLRVITVRGEVLQDITESDCLAEGITKTEISKDIGYRYFIPGTDMAAHRARQAYAALWDGFYAKKGYEWDTNPWVWVIDFEKEDADKMAILAGKIPSDIKELIVQDKEILAFLRREIERRRQ